MINGKDVMAAQTDLVEIIGAFRPRVVKMAGGQLADLAVPFSAPILVYVYAPTANDRRELAELLRSLGFVQSDGLGLAPKYQLTSPAWNALWLKDRQFGPAAIDPPGAKETYYVRVAWEQFRDDPQGVYNVALLAHNPP